MPDPSQNPEWYGEMWLKYPHSSALYPAKSGELFKAKAEFHAILNDAGHRIFDTAAHPKKPTVAEVAELYIRFRSWYDHLPEPLTPRMIVLPAELKLQ